MKLSRLMVGMRHCAEAASIAAREITIRPFRLVGLLAALCLVGGCKEEAVSPPLAQVRVTTAQLIEFAPVITVTGVIAAQVQADLGFRLSGKISDCYVDTGHHVPADQVLPKLDPVEQHADIDPANAALRSPPPLPAHN